MSKVAAELGRVSGVSIISLVNALLLEACRGGASDIHIDPRADYVRVRFRIDSILFDAYQLPASVHAEVISRIKIMAGLRTDEHQATQDGRIRFKQGNDFGVDMRVSIVPTYHGENVRLRILSGGAKARTLEDLGFSASDQTKILTAVKKPNGMILATGPTGSGKTTTLYTLVDILNDPEVSILTIEDPIEYAVPDITQIQVNPRAQLTFANGLRSILRQNPNIIMVGEIRDAETATIAVHTALTGHLLLSTLHTNDAATTVPRLLDMGVDAYLVASTVNVAIAQRLARKICESCKVAVRLTDVQKAAMLEVPSRAKDLLGSEIYRGVGCEACHYSGFKGRVCINEVLVVDENLRDAILRKASATDIRTLAIAQGMTPMLEDGCAKVSKGVTTIEEVLRVVYV